jgi:hypothetical protein
MLLFSSSSSSSFSLHSPEDINPFMLILLAPANPFCHLPSLSLFLFVTFTFYSSSCALFLVHQCIYIQLIFQTSAPCLFSPLLSSLSLSLAGVCYFWPLHGPSERRGRCQHLVFGQHVNNERESHFFFFCSAHRN